MTDEVKVDNKRWAGFIVVILMARTTGDILSALIGGITFEILPYGLHRLMSPILGYGIAGILAGLCINFLLQKRGKEVLKWLPLLLLAAILFSSFLNLFSAGRVGGWSVFGILGLLLSRISGYSYLFFLPFISGVTLWYLEAKRNKSEISISSCREWLKSALLS